MVRELHNAYKLFLLLQFAQLLVQYFQLGKTIQDRHHDMLRDGANPLSLLLPFKLMILTDSYTGAVQHVLRS
jgi:hypothetical protein